MNKIFFKVIMFKILLFLWIYILFWLYWNLIEYIKPSICELFIWGLWDDTLHCLWWTGILYNNSTLIFILLIFITYFISKIIASKNIILNKSFFCSINILKNYILSLFLPTLLIIISCIREKNNFWYLLNLFFIIWIINYIIVVLYVNTLQLKNKQYFYLITLGLTFIEVHILASNYIL